MLKLDGSIHYLKLNNLKILHDKTAGTRNFLHQFPFKQYMTAVFCWLLFYSGSLVANTISAGVGKANITNLEEGMVANDSLYVKALLLEDADKRIVFITIDVVALEEIGHIPEGYLPTVRKILNDRFQIDPGNVFVNASHCHGIPSDDVIEKTISAVARATENIEPVTLGFNKAQEDRISVNRRIKLKNGQERDIRHAYSMPADDAVEDVGKIDPEIGIMCIQTLDDDILAVVYNYSCHPIQGVPSRGRRDNTTGYPGYASELVEQTLDEGAMAFFFQGCAGDINPVLYKNVSTPRNSETLGVLLGSRVLEQINEVEVSDVALIQVVNDFVRLPLADLSETIDSLETRKEELIRSLRGNSLNFKTFLDLYLRYHLHEEYPSYYAHLYLHEKKLGKEEFSIMDSENKALVEDYEDNISAMEEITVVNANLSLLKKHQKSYESAQDKWYEAEINVIKLGNFVLVTFPGELSVEIGLNIKKQSPFEHTYVAAYTNGYLYYAPTDEQLKNRGGAQEDSECILGMGWQKIFEQRVNEILRNL